MRDDRLPQGNIRMATDNYASFLIRLVQENTGETELPWRGELESIQSGQTWSFLDIPALCQLLQTEVETISWRDQAPGDHEQTAPD